MKNKLSGFCRFETSDVDGSVHLRLFFSGSVWSMVQFANLEKQSKLIRNEIGSKPKFRYTQG